MERARRGWIGVDLDGTWARYDGWKGDSHIGEPIPAMTERIKRWLEEDRLDVKIMTARVSSRDADEVAYATKLIQDYSEKHVNRRLEVTCKKDYQMVEQWDDRALQILPNTGVPLRDVVEHLMNQLKAANVPFTFMP